MNLFSQTASIVMCDFRRDRVLVSVREAASGTPREDFEVPFSVGQERPAGEEIKRKLARVRRRAAVIALIPRSALVMQAGIWPSQEETELRQMLELHFARQTPHHRTEIVFDLMPVCPLPGNKALVASLMATESILKTFLNVLNYAGLEPDWLTVSSLKFAVPFLGSVDKDSRGQGRVLVAVEENIAVFCFMVGARVVFCREDEIAADLFNMCRSFLEQCREMVPGQGISEIMVAGRGSTLAQKELDGIAVTAVVSPDPLAGMVRYYQTRGPVLNLLPHSLCVRREQGMRRRFLFHLAILGGIGLGLWAVVESVSWVRKAAVVRDLRQQVMDIRGRAEEIEKKRDMIAAFRGYAQGRTAVVTVMAATGRVLPSDAVLETVDRNRDGWRFTGNAASIEAVRLFQEGLAASGVLPPCRIENVDKRPAETGEVARFVVSCRERPYVSR